MSATGVKLQDMKISSPTKTELYFRSEDIPKEVSEDFNTFFCKYFFDIENKNIKSVNKRILFYNNSIPILWITTI